MVGFDRASWTAASNARELAIKVVEVTIPSRWASMIPRLTPAVRPKSSALTIRRRTRQDSRRSFQFLGILYAVKCVCVSSVRSSDSQMLIGECKFFCAHVYSRGSRKRPSSLARLPMALEVGSEGWLAQLVRAPALQAGGRRFESCTTHQIGVRSQTGDVVQLVRTLPCHGRGRGFESRRPRQFFSMTCRLSPFESGRKLGATASAVVPGSKCTERMASPSPQRSSLSSKAANTCSSN